MKKIGNFKILLAIFVLGVFILAPSAKVLADSSSGQSSEQDSQKSSTDSSKTDSNHNGVPDKTETENERQVQQDVNTQDGQAQIQSELKAGNQKNSFQFELQAKDRVEFSFHYKSEVNSSKTQVEMKFEFRRLVEFVDNTTNPTNLVNAFDSQDTVVQQIDFQSLTWHMYYSRSSVNNQNVYSIVVNATKGAMLVEFSFFVSSGFVNQSNYMLTPNAVKFNLEIKNFPFRQSNSQLAAEVKIKNDVQNRQIENETEDSKNGYSGPQQQLAFNNNSVGAFFSWAKSYSADGVNKTIIVSPVTTDTTGEGTQAKMYFNFAQAKDIFWDPEVGVTLASIMGTSSTPGFEFLAILAIPVVALIFRKRRIKN